MLTLQLFCLVATALSVGYCMGRRSARSSSAWFGGSRRSRLARQAINLMAGGGGNADPAFDPPEVSTVTQSILLARALSKDQASAPSVYLLHPIVE